MSFFHNPEADWTPQEVARRLEAGEIELIDVREPYEREAGFIEGSRHIELERLASEAGSIPRERPVVFQCRLGSPSGLGRPPFAGGGRGGRHLAGRPRG